MARRKKGRRADGSFEYKATIGKDLTGKRIQKSFYGSSLAEAKKKAEQYKLNKAVTQTIGMPLTPSGTTFGEWAEKWAMIYKKPYVTPQTYEMYRLALDKHILPYFGAARLSDIRPIDVQTFFSAQRKYSISFQHKLLITLKAIFNTAIENDLIYKNPANKIKLTSDAVKAEKKALTDDQIKQIETAATNQFDAVIFLLETGLRRGELLGLMWKDIDFENRTLTVSRSYSIVHGKGTICPPKHNSRRTIPLMPAAIEVLLRQVHHSLYVFPSPRAHKLEDPNHFNRRLKNWMQQFPEELRCSPHELRHSFASRLQRKGVDIYTISSLLGHRDIEVTASVYVHPDIASFRRKLEAALLDEESTTNNLRTIAHD